MRAAWMVAAVCTRSVIRARMRVSRSSIWARPDRTPGGVGWPAGAAAPVGPLGRLVKSQSASDREGSEALVGLGAQLPTMARDRCP
ncbi:MAG: hypothetical protein AUG49_04625 [Catenulispora sp. 13_1_20CM_3_70_7]|nr:MAG: hypothetical protein AUG49_04625 [Catenulispora sp. 13_1_20CM_3_70_7]